MDSSAQSAFATKCQPVRWTAENQNRDAPEAKVLLMRDFLIEARFLGGRQQSAILQSSQPRITGGMAFVALEEVEGALDLREP